MNSQIVEIDEVYRIHRAIIKRAGTKASVRDFALLHSAVGRPRATFGGKDLYPNIFLKAAALFQSLCRNHPFTDGNKRTSYAATHLLLWRNGYYLKPEKKDAIEFTVHVDDQKPDIKEIAAWLKKNSKRIGR